MIMEVPKITVWTPVFNGEKLLERAILSVVNQTQNPFEYIIIDDGSTDSSFLIATLMLKNILGLKVFRNDSEYWSF